MTTHKVAVIGAGLSGLTAAYQLREFNPIVLESEVRIGGRSQRTELSGWPVSSGGEGWYDPNPHSPESTFLTSLGVQFMSVTGPALLHANGEVRRFVSAEVLAGEVGLSEEAVPDFLRTFDRVRDTCAALAQSPTDQALLKDLLSRSAIDWLGAVHPEVIAFYRRLSAVELGTYLETSSAFLFLYGMPPFGGASDVWMSFLVPDGGAPMVSVAMAQALPSAPVVNAMVTSVDQDASGVTIRYRVGAEEMEVHAEYVVIATPPLVTSELVRNLPTEKLAGLGKISSGPIVEVSMLLADGGPAPWDELSAMWTIDKTFSVCLHSKTDYENRLGDGAASKHSVIKMIAVGTNALPLADRSDEAIAAAFIADFADMFPESTGKLVAHSVKRWMHGVQGAQLGIEEYIEELPLPVGRIHFAGDWCGFVDTANPGGMGIDGDWGAYGVNVGLNSAVRAGLRASAEVAARIDAAVDADV